MSVSKAFYLATLGCKVNQYESHALREAWEALGMPEAARPEDAGCIVVNSCAVTAKAVADVRHTVSRLHRAAPDASIIVTGCAAEVMAAELASLPGVVRVVAQSNKTELLRLASGAEAAEGPTRAGSGPGRIAASDSPHPQVFPPFSVSGYDRSRAVLKVQDGCSHGCTYCIVPLTRGRARSRSFDEALEEARRLLASGFREIVISGVNLRQYRSSEGDFWDFLSRLDASLSPEWAGQARLRLSSLEPGQLGGRALEALSACRMVAPHIHLSLQSGSPGVLTRMGRGHYDPASLPDFLERLRGLWPVFGLGADLLTGFPAESDEEFAEGLELIRALPLTYTHVFPFSRRPGTRAASLPGQIAQTVKKERAARLRALVGEKKQIFLRKLLAESRLSVVFENRGEQGGSRKSPRGLCEYYVDCRLASDGHGKAATPSGVLTPARPVGMDGDVLLVKTEPPEGACV